MLYFFQLVRFYLKFTLKKLLVYRIIMDHMKFFDVQRKYVAKALITLDNSRLPHSIHTVYILLRIKNSLLLEI